MPPTVSRGVSFLLQRAAMPNVYRIGSCTGKLSTLSPATFPFWLKIAPDISWQRTHFYNQDWCVFIGRGEKPQ